MKLDVLGQTVLQDIQKHAGLERAIIAGGFCRDQIMGGKFKDIDIFVPALSFAQISAFLENLPEDWKLISNRPVEKVKRGYQLVEHIANIIDFKYMDCIDIQVMNTQVPDQDGFGMEVIRGFNYGIDKVYSDGVDFIQHEDHLTDIRLSIATLVDRSVNLHTLPHHMKKYFRLVEKYPELEFRCPYIQFDNGVKIAEGVFAPKVWGKKIEGEFINQHRDPRNGERIGNPVVGPHADGIHPRALPEVHNNNMRDHFAMLDRNELP